MSGELPTRSWSSNFPERTSFCDFFALQLVYSTPASRAEEHFPSHFRIFHLFRGEVLKHWMCPLSQALVHTVPHLTIQLELRQQYEHVGLNIQRIFKMLKRGEEKGESAERSVSSFPPHRLAL